MFTLVHMIPYVRTDVAISTSQGNLPLFLREETRRFRPIWQEGYRDQAEKDSRNSLLITTQVLGAFGSHG